MAILLFIVIVIIVTGIVIGFTEGPTTGIGFVLVFFCGLVLLEIRRKWLTKMIGPYPEMWRYQLEKKKYSKRRNAFLEEMKAEGREINVGEMSNVEEGDKIRLISDSNFRIAPGTIGKVAKIELIFKGNKNHKEVFVEWNNGLINYETETPIENSPLIVGLDEFEIIR